MAGLPSGQTGLAAAPAVCRLALMRQHNQNILAPRTLLDVAVVCFCLVVMVVGTSIAVGDIIAARAEGK